MTIEELNKIKNKKESSNTRITIGMASCGIAAGAKELYEYLVKEKKKQKLKIDVITVGCLGVCRLEPIVEVYQNGSRVSYVKVTKEKLDTIISKHILNNEIVTEYLVDPNTKCLLDTTFIKKQTRLVLDKCGLINPEDINEYIKYDGYQALYKVLNKMSKEDVIAEIKASGLRGRGGAGFSTGLKWEFTYKAVGDKKYVCCNADEGDPGAFMDRSVLEGNPHSVIEAMIIAAYTIGSNQGYIYVRAEYPVAVSRLKIAIKEAKELGFLGNNIFGTDFSFDLDIRLGAGAFVCGEETALMASIEGKRGEPRVKPPFPAKKGLFQKPTLLNNVETYANIPYIILNGASKFAEIGTEKSKGTKVFALGGKINNTGLVEVPIGTPLKTIIYEIGEGIPNNKKFKAAQTGGPSGGCIPASEIDIPMDYDTLNSIGSMMGSGGLIVVDEDNCMVDLAKFFLDFTVDESCGKCNPCRIGTKRLYELIDRITKGKGKEGDIEKLEELCLHIKDSSLCGLGQSAPNPVLSTLKYFKEEYVAHINDKKCPSHKCQALLSYIINDNCIGCDICAKNCPVHAISGAIKEKHIIDQSICIKCGLCYTNCKFKAIDKE